MEKLTPIPALFNGIKSLADASLRLTFETQDIVTIPEDVRDEIMSKLRKQGYLLFVLGGDKVDLDSLEIPENAPEFKGDKTPSQRLRGVLFVLWKQLGEKGAWAAFYEAEMEKITNHYKSKLEDK